MQSNLDRSEYWKIISGMKSNKNKYQIQHLGWRNTGHKYRVGLECVVSSPAERDLGLLVSSSSV